MQKLRDLHDAVCASVCVCVMCDLEYLYVNVIRHKSAFLLPKNFLFVRLVFGVTIGPKTQGNLSSLALHACTVWCLWIHRPFFWLPKTIIVNLRALTRSHTTYLCGERLSIPFSFGFTHKTYNSSTDIFAQNWIEISQYSPFSFCLSPSDPLNCILISFCLFTYLPLLSAFEAPTMHITCILCFISHIQFHIQLHKEKILAPSTNDWKHRKLSYFSLRSISCLISHRGSSFSCDCNSLRIHIVRYY